MEVNELSMKKKLRIKLINFLADFGETEKGKNLIKQKLNNICGKTGRYNVPEEIFQKRTPRDNRVLIEWKTVKNNNLTLDQLKSFENGITIDFINEDFFSTDDTSPLKNFLKNQLGSDENISSIISIKSQDGSSSSRLQRDSYEKLLSTKIKYNGTDISLNENNLKGYTLKKKEGFKGGKGNEKWEGFLYISIKGGQQDTINSHTGEITIFNPACEYANEEVKLDIDLTLLYFALHSIKLTEECKEKYNYLKTHLEIYLKKAEYDNESYQGNLLDYCKNHPCLKMGNNQNLIDPIQLEDINIIDFSEPDKTNLNSVDFTHDEAVRLDKYYWDNKKCCVLSPARPTNVFWSRHLSNMMQQDFSLDEFFKKEEERVNKRKQVLKKKLKK